AGAGRPRPALFEDELGLQEPALVFHRLLACAANTRRLARALMERLDDVPVADELRQELLARSRPGPRLVRGLWVFLLPRRLARPDQNAKHKRDQDQAGAWERHESSHKGHVIEIGGIHRLTGGLSARSQSRSMYSARRRNGSSSGSFKSLGNSL